MKAFNGSILVGTLHFDIPIPYIHVINLSIALYTAFIIKPGERRPVGARLVY